jgi:hypothetical protein
LGGWGGNGVVEEVAECDGGFDGGVCAHGEVGCHLV